MKPESLSFLTLSYLPDILGIGIGVLFIGGAYVTLEDYIPEEAKPYVTAACASALWLFSFLFLSFRLKVILFKWISSLFFVPILWVIIEKRVRREINARFKKPANSSEWICKKCGEENFKIRRECYNCGHIKGVISTK